MMPVFAIDLDSTVNDSSRKNYTVPKTTVQPNSTTTKQITNTVQSGTKSVTEVVPQTPVSTQVMEKTVLPAVPALPQKAYSSTAAHTNTQYSGKVPNADAIIPCSINSSKITDYMCEGQKLTFLTTQEIYTPYFRIPAKTKLTAEIVDSHRPQMSCNGGLVAFRIVSAQINGYTQPLNAGIIKIKTDRVYFSNLKGNHTYWKTTCKKAKWGQKIFTKWSRTSSRLASKGPAIILSPFPYLGGCVLAAASTVTSPVTALLGKGGSLVVPANTTFTIKLYDDAKIRY